MTFVLVAIFFLLLLVSPFIALVFAVALLLLALLLELASARVRRLFDDAEDDFRAMAREEADRIVADVVDPALEQLALRAPRVITGPDHPLAAIGRVPIERGEDRDA